MTTNATKSRQLRRPLRRSDNPRKIGHILRGVNFSSIAGMTDAELNRRFKLDD